MHADVKATPSGSDIVASSLCSTDGTAGSLRGLFSSLMERDVRLDPPGVSICPYTNDLSVLRCQNTPGAAKPVLSDLPESSLDVDI